MSKEEKRYLQWGYESYRDTQTGEVRSDYVDLLNKQDQQLAELKAENERLKTCKCCECQSENEYHLRGIVSDLEQQLKEKDEEIKKLKECIPYDANDWYEGLKAYMQKCKVLEYQLNSNTKQVCEKIRELWKKQAVYYHICDYGQELKNKTYQCTILGMNEILFDNIIKQIEKGDENVI